MELISAKEARDTMPCVTKWPQLDGAIEYINGRIIKAKDKGLWKTDITLSYVGDEFDGIVKMKLKEAGYNWEVKCWTYSNHDDEGERRIVSVTYEISWWCMW